MDRNLKEFRIRGVKTNIPFLNNVVTHEKFYQGPLILALLIQHQSFSSSLCVKTVEQSC